ncbi:MAG TPA: M14 family metallopeptidase [Ramlibacter sp.]|uniref:M14 family metallopeptidase n=1 Tax=Ramlibacter sp. TaxID=1917967 RepID=UPI002BAEB57E|nr:M14 family metallopeptidase [Ramlibacter sp.]HVZ42302.1 M14 family metallopeptidase [Ramlibacter sp.]
MKGPFSESYAEARDKFLDACAAAGLAAESLVHPQKGRDGETLAMDVVRDGHPNAARLLILTSGCHGVEGYCGSGIQIAALRDAAWRERSRERGVAVLYVHALNPYGFSHIRRVTHENVDLNRNFHDFSRPLPANEGYRELHDLLLPPTWPPDAANQQAIGTILAQRGEAALQAVITRGQHEFEDGMFFGGTSPTWSNRTFREVLRAHGHRAARIAWIDFHTGLGPPGIGERILATRNDEAALARARAWWDTESAKVTSIYDGSSTSAFLTGLMCSAVYDECPQAEYTGLALEYGTVPVLQTLGALRAEHWLHLHPEAPRELAAQIKQQMMQAFYTDSDVWREAVLAQGREAMVQAVEGISA